MEPDVRDPVSLKGTWSSRTRKRQVIAGRVPISYPVWAPSTSHLQRWEGEKGHGESRHRADLPRGAAAASYVESEQRCCRLGTWKLSSSDPVRCHVGGLHSGPHTHEVQKVGGTMPGKGMSGLELRLLSPNLYVHHLK